MPSKDPRIDAYIKSAGDFAKPILNHLRDLVHKACPDVEETMKWSFPHFDYKGVMCSMAAMTQHCSFGFWKASLMKDPEKLLNLAENAAMGSFGRIVTLNDLPADKALIQYIKEAVKLNDQGIKLPQKERPAEKKALPVPKDLSEALKKYKKANDTFQKFSPSQRKEYILWISVRKQKPQEISGWRLLLNGCLKEREDIGNMSDELTADSYQPSAFSFE